MRGISLAIIVTQTIKMKMGILLRRGIPEWKYRTTGNIRINTRIVDLQRKPVKKKAIAVSRYRKFRVSEKLSRYHKVPVPHRKASISPRFLRLATTSV